MERSITLIAPLLTSYLDPVLNELGLIEKVQELILLYPFVLVPVNEVKGLLELSLCPLALHSNIVHGFLQELLALCIVKVSVVVFVILDPDFVDCLLHFGVYSVVVLMYSCSIACHGDVVITHGQIL